MRILRPLSPAPVSQSLVAENTHHGVPAQKGYPVDFLRPHAGVRGQRHLRPADLHTPSV